MGWIGIVLWVLTHATDLIALVREIIALFHSLPHGEGRLMRDEIGEAIRSTGDKAQVQAVMEKWKAKCANGGAADGGGELGQST